MRTIVLVCALLLAAGAASAQGTFRATVKNEETQEPVAGATVSLKGAEISATTGADGVAELTGVPDGEQTVVVFAVGYEQKELSLTFPAAAQTSHLVLIKVTTDFGGVTVTTTRTGREIDDEPTRVEAIDEEEVGEKMNMRPANVSMVLNESTGIKVQQTSATTNTQTVRIQGLDGRYTQLLKDGFPAFGGFSGSLGVLDIPPLDLKQVEIVKGPAATFYGGGAIAGVVNFVSREPEDEPVTNLIFNQTSALGTDFSVFDARRFGRFASTLLGSVNYQREYDADGDDFTELPRTRSFNLAPRLFFDLDADTRLTVGNFTSYQRREGGDVVVIDGRGDAFHQYFERHASTRNVTTLQLDRALPGGRRLVARQSLAFFGRDVEVPGYRFGGRQFNAYTDVSYFQAAGRHALVFGFNAVHDRFTEDRGVVPFAPRDERRTTFGAYAQDGFDVNARLSLEAGFRLDYVRGYGLFALPRVSALYRFTDRLTSRLGFGFGYKAPSLFTEEAETLLFRGVMPVGDALRAERSRGATFDFNYRGAAGDKLSYSLNQMFFYTRIADPLVLTAAGAGAFRFANAARPVTSAGFETNARLAYGLARLFAGYTHTRARAHYLPGPNRELPLAPRHRLNSALLFEREDDFKAGVEAYYTGRQFLTDRARTRPFWVFGLFGEKTFGRFSLFVNAENFTDTRQGRFTPVVLGPHQQPTFAEIYTHTEGRVFNGGIKLRL